MRAGQYARDTQVSVERSRAELERVLQQAGAENIGYMTRHDKFTWLFTLKGRNIMIDIPLPDRNSLEFTHTPQTRVLRSERSAQAAYEQAVRQRYRQTLLWVKAKLEAAAVPITTIEDEFLPHTVVGATGVTVGQWLRHQDLAQLEPGRSMPALPAGR
jgi:hypothetical protein